jgi:hypothetical protein
MCGWVSCAAIEVAGGNKFDGYFAIDRGLIGAVHRAHTAFANLFPQFVLSESPYRTITHISALSGGLP